MKIQVAKRMAARTVHLNSFTLVELLVVITILAVLAALLMPALGSAKDRSKTVKCANNEKQMGSAFGSYLNDNNGFYPYIYPDGSTNDYCNCGLPGYVACCGGAQCTASMGWNIVLAPYYGYGLYNLPNCPGSPSCANSFSQRIQQNMCGVTWCSTCSAKTYQEVSTYAPYMQCPSNPWPIPLFGATASGCLPANVYGGFAQPGGGATWRMMASNYAMNGNGFPYTWRTGNAVCTNNSGWYKRENIADINHPANLALIGEMPWDVWTTGSPANVWNATYLPGQIYMTANVVSNSTLATQWQKPTPSTYCNGYVAAWHAMSMNTLFPDGHVAQVKQTDLYNNASQFTKGGGTSGTPGENFWGDGKAANWFANQFPGYNFPKSVQ